MIIDQVTAPADTQGFAGGDLVVSVGGRPTPNLESFVVAADAMRDRADVTMQIVRADGSTSLRLMAGRLGTANGEFAPMIPPDAPIPHGNAAGHARTMHLAALPACKTCHPIRPAGTGPMLDLNAVLLNPPTPPGATP